jgi:serine/threonine protein phosphatase PrpC
LRLTDYHIAIGNATDIGRLRDENEDYLAHFDSPWGYCIIICDGMGGHTGGQVAAHTSIIAIRQYLQDAQNGASGISPALENSIEFANFQIRQLIKEKPSLTGMGTTCVLAVIRNGKLYTAHAGDSRIYLIRNNDIKQITKDHSSVQQLIDDGILTKAEAEMSNKKNEILKAIGIFERVFPAVLEEPIELQRNDKLLLCSDGLTDMVNEVRIAETIRSIEDVQNASLRLVEIANENGGRDNITVQVVHYTGNAINEKIGRKMSKRSDD